MAWLPNISSKIYILGQVNEFQKSQVHVTPHPETRESASLTRRKFLIWEEKLGKKRKF